MRAVWKFPLEITDYQTIEMPAGAQILSFDVQGVSPEYMAPCLWALVAPAMPREKRTFQMVGTGHQLPDEPGKFIGTVVTYGGTLVWHLFEVLR